MYLPKERRWFGVLLAVLFAAPGSHIFADHPPPIAFSEHIVAQGGFSLVNIELQFFDPAAEASDAGFVPSEIFKSPANLPFVGGSAASQACGFFGNCAFQTLDFIGRDELRFTILSSATHGEEAYSSLPGIVTIEVVETIETPIAFAKEVGTIEGFAVPIRPGGTAPDASSLTYTIVTEPDNGTLDLSSAAIREPVTYTPAPGFSGNDQFEFVVSDGTTESAPATVSITGVNFSASDIEVAIGDTVINTELEVEDGSSIRFTLPPNNAGTVDITVSTSAGESLYAEGFTYAATVTGLVSAVLPASRSVQVGTDATAFGVIVNSGNATLKGCGISLVSTLNASFAFQTTNPDTNVLTGSEGSVVDIPANGSQTFVFRLTPNSETLPTDVEFAFQCDNAEPAATFAGVNTLHFTASVLPVPDVIALTAVSSDPARPGTLSLNGTASGKFFAVATANVGAADNITVTADSGGASLPLNIQVCETAQECLSNNQTQLDAEMAANSTGAFFFLVRASAEIPFRPDVSRIFVRFRDLMGVVRGSTSVAVTTD